MRHVFRIVIMVFAASIVATAVAAGCASTPHKTEASTSGIHDAEDVGAAKVPQTSLQLDSAPAATEQAKPATPPEATPKTAPDPIPSPPPKK